MRHRLKARIYSRNGIIEGTLVDPIGTGILIADSITVWANSMLVTLPIENVTRICILPEIINSKPKDLVESWEQITLLEIRPVA